MKKKVYIIPGWNSRGSSFADVAETVAGMVRHAFDCDSVVETIRWETCDASFEIASQLAREYVGRFALRLYDTPREERENTIIFAHSLGAVVALNALVSLQSVGAKIEHATLLGAAIPYDSDTIPLAALAVKYPMWNVSNKQDLALRVGYTFVEESVPLGACPISPYFKNIALDLDFAECFVGHAFRGYLAALENLYTFNNITE